MGLLVPLENSVLAQDVDLVQEKDDFVERLEEVHVVVAILLDLVEEVDFRFEVVGEGGEEGEVLFQVTEGLVLEQLFLLVPLHTGHYTLPNQNDNILLGNSSLDDDFLDVGDDGRRGLLVGDGVVERLGDLGANVGRGDLVAESYDLRQVPVGEDPLEVLLRLLLIIGWEELHESVLGAGLLDDGSDGGASLFSLEGAQQLQQELQSGAVLDLVFIDENW